VEDKVQSLTKELQALNGEHELRLAAFKECEEGRRREAQLIELCAAPILVWDFNDDEIVKWNRSSSWLYGYSPEEAIGQKRHVLLQTSVIESSFADLKRELSKKGTWNGEA